MAAKSEPANTRGYGQGTITEHRAGVYRLRIFVGNHPVTGKPMQRSKLFSGSRAGAERALTELRLQVERDRAAGVGVSQSRVTLGHVVDAHLAASQTQLAPGTLAAYASARKLHLPDAFAKKRVDSLTAQSFRDLYAWLASRDLSDSSIWKVYALLSGALTRAIREHGVPFDSKQMVSPKKPAAAKRQMASDIELVSIFAKAATLGDDWPLLFRLACATGMRRGELVGVRWSSLDPTGVLFVDQGIVASKGALISKSTKSGHSRYVQLDRATVEMWNATKATRRALVESLQLPFSDDLFVFPAVPEGASPRRPDRVTKIWEQMRIDLSLNPQLEFRALRNWHVSILDECGFELAKIGRRVGHSQPNAATAMTSHYSLAERLVDAQMATAVGTRLAAIGGEAVAIGRRQIRRGASTDKSTRARRSTISQPPGQGPTTIQRR